MPKQIVLVRINGEVHGKITPRSRGIVFALCDDKGTHLSISKKQESVFHVEVSSDQPLAQSGTTLALGSRVAAAGRERKGTRRAAYSAARAANLSFDSVPCSGMPLLLLEVRPLPKSVTQKL